MIHFKKNMIPSSLTILNLLNVRMSFVLIPPSFLSPLPMNVMSFMMSISFSYLLSTLSYVLNVELITSFFLLFLCLFLPIPIPLSSAPCTPSSLDLIKVINLESARLCASLVKYLNDLYPFILWRKCALRNVVLIALD